jgi:hypothetical protein
MDLSVERERLHMYDIRRRLVKTTVCIVRACRLREVPRSDAVVFALPPQDKEAWNS